MSNIKNARAEFPYLIEIFEQVGMGSFTKTGRGLTSITRGSWRTPDPLVILYSLYKMAEANGLYQYTLERLMDFSIDSEGISPAQIFGLDIEATVDLMRGLRSTNSDFLGYDEALGMRTINLKREKTSKDVLELF
jgi:phosphoadenosine phosphosulfate reductase